MPDSVHARAHARHPARRDLRNGQVGAQAGVLHGARHRRPVAPGESRHPHRDRRLHRQHRRGRDHRPPVAGAGRSGAGVSRDPRRRAQPHDRQGLRARESDRGQHDGGRTRAEPAGRAAPDPVRRIAVLVGTLALVARALAAQHPGQFEAGAFGSYTRYDPGFGLGRKPGGGVRLGYSLGKFVGVEGDLVFQPEYTVTPPGGTANTLQPLIAGASLVVNALHAPRLTLYALGGYSLLDFGTRAPYHFTDNAVHGGAGIRLFLTNRIAVRVEGRAIVTPSTKYVGLQSVTHYLGTVGLSVLHLGTERKDSDGDGVPDSKDACPGTPAGAVVDQRGCPLDADQDGVPDGLDKCPGTPAGAHVDATGCPTDADADGVPDGLDQCPNTLAGLKVDAQGCPLDSDADGVPDGIDQCPATRARVAVDPKGR